MRVGDCWRGVAPRGSRMSSRRPRSGASRPRRTAPGGVACGPIGSRRRRSPSRRSRAVPAIQRSLAGSPLRGVPGRTNPTAGSPCSTARSSLAAELTRRAGPPAMTAGDRTTPGRASAGAGGEGCAGRSGPVAPGWRPGSSRRSLAWRRASSSLRLASPRRHRPVVVGCEDRLHDRRQVPEDALLGDDQPIVGHRRERSAGIVGAERPREASRSRDPTKSPVASSRKPVGGSDSVTVNCQRSVYGRNPLVHRSTTLPTPARRRAPTWRTVEVDRRPPAGERRSVAEDRR